jgi:hypothetical protein
MKKLIYLTLLFTLPLAQANTFRELSIQAELNECRFQLHEFKRGAYFNGTSERMPICDIYQIPGKTAEGNNALLFQVSKNGIPISREQQDFFAFRETYEMLVSDQCELSYNYQAKKCKVVLTGGDDKVAIIKVGATLNIDYLGKFTTKEEAGDKANERLAELQEMGICR